MTEAMSRREIEDVLTSIKRLVSHEVQSRVMPTAPVAEKLVLTPSLRVHDGAEDATQSPVDTTESPPLAPEEAGQEAQTVAEDDFRKSARFFPHVPAEEPNMEPDASKAPDLPGAASSLLRRISQAGLTQTPAVPDRTEQVNAPPDVAPTVPNTPETPDALSDILVPPSEDAELEATLARLEAVLSSGKSQSSLPRADAPPSDAAPAPQADLPSGEQIIDEGMLYQLVAHIVRQELQGELGEKITRNIRKLVRAEVARELQLRRP